jgi:NAD(P)-dependent dehydrogenase (short-subunit alcohol dehydrogenase family)
MNNVNERTALITGASRGLGLALARGLAARRWNLIITGRDPERLRLVRNELARVTHVAALAGDVTDHAHRVALAVLAQGHAGLDAVVNNAGALGPSPQPVLLEYPLEVLSDVFRANVLAPLGVLQALCDQLKPGARVINVTSDAGKVAYPGWGGYGATKAALEQLSAVLAVENPELKVYWVDPGDMRTDMHQAAFPGEDISDRPLPDARVPGFIALLESDLPSGRYSAAELEQAAAGAGTA